MLGEIESKTVDTNKEGDRLRKKKCSTVSEAKLVENICKNPHSFLEISPVQKEVLLLHKLLFINLSFRELWSDWEISGLHPF